VKLRFILAAFLMVPFAACSQLTTPQNIAQQTVLDEKVKNGAELSYQFATKFGRMLAQNGLIDKDKFKASDNLAFAALGRVRAAYAAGNADNFNTAIEELNIALAGIDKLVK